MTWILLAVAGAVFNALKNVLTKKVSGPLDPYTVALASNLVLLPVLWTATLFAGNYVVEPAFWTQMVLMLPVEILVTILFFKAFKDAELSSSFPFVSFLPFFVAIGSYFILGEALSQSLLIGLVLLSAGAFMVNRINAKEPHFVWRGALYMFTVSALWGYIIPMGKLAVTYSSPQLFPAIYFTLATILFIPVYLMKRTTPLRKLTPHPLIFIGIGFAFGIFQLLNWAAYARGPASGVSALALLAVLFTVIIGGTYFKDRHLFGKVIATVLMVGGAVVIILLQ